MDEFYTNLVDIFEVDEVNPDSVLRDFENWDFLTVLSILAMRTPHMVSSYLRTICCRSPRPANSRILLPPIG